MSEQLSSLKELPANKESDLIGKILKVFEIDEFTFELRIKDTSNEMWFIQIPKLKFGTLKEEEIVRIRSVEVNFGSKRNVVKCRPGSNILKFTLRSTIVQEMRQKIEPETAADKMMLDDANEVITNPVFYT